MKRIYLDHAATTPVRPEVVEAMLPYLQERWGNPSSLHADGASALEGVERARAHVASLLGAQPDEIIFTGSGTEADNHALIGVSAAHAEKGRHIITSMIEHHAILDTARFLEGQGRRVTYLPVDSAGRVDPGSVRDAMTDDTVLVSIMHANNEVGTIQPIAEIGSLCRAREVLLHTDAVQTTGHVQINVEEMGIDLLSLSAHKLYGPKGVGALFVRKGTRLASFVHGGGQERGRRASTENVAGIVGLGEAARLAARGMTSEPAHSAALRDRLIAGLLERVPEVRLTGDPVRRLPNNASFCVAGVEGESLLLNLDLEGFSVSTGSACASGSLEPSHVLLAMGIPAEVARGSVRVTVGRGNTGEDITRFLDLCPPIVDRLRKMAPVSRA